MAVDYKRMKESLKCDIKKRNSKFKPEDIAMKQEALREICEKEGNTKEALAYNLDLRKTLNVILSDKGKLSPV